MVKTNVADLQDFDSMDTKESTLSVRKEESLSKPGPSKKLKVKQARSTN